MAAVLTRAPGPSWSCPTCARTTGAELELSDVGAHRAELDAATMAAVLACTTGPSWSCPTRAPGELDAATMAAILEQTPG
ncbi:MAG: hypothetical protein JXB05_28425 [Myxococcaceae bacterium]|nr:hypothetical protein [Myxococcaceae bacterium]